FREITVHGEENRTTPIGERHVYPPHGIHGGGEGSLAEIVLNPRTDEAKALHSKGVTSIPSGATARFQTSGAGGYGSPFERDPELVRADVVDELVSPQAAMDKYGVVLAASVEVDADATSRRRAQGDGL